MSLGEKIKEQRKQAGLSQEQLAEKLNVSRQAITKWETDKGIPDVANLLAISDEFGLSLDELIKGNVAVKKKIIADSSAKKWHILVIVYLLAIVAYIAYFAVCHRILMIGFLIATLFMLFFELRIFIKERIYRQGKNKRQNKSGGTKEHNECHKNHKIQSDNFWFVEKIQGAHLYGSSLVCALCETEHPGHLNSGIFASLCSKQGAAPLAPLCGYPCMRKGATTFVTPFASRG